MPEIGKEREGEGRDGGTGDEADRIYKIGHRVGDRIGERWSGEENSDLAEIIKQKVPTTDNVLIYTYICTHIHTYVCMRMYGYINI